MNITPKEFIRKTEVAYTPRILSGVAVALTIIVLAILVASSPVASAAFQTTCLNIAMYSGIAAGGFLSISLIRDAIEGILVGQESTSLHGFKHFLAKAGQSMIVPTIAGSIAVILIFV